MMRISSAARRIHRTAVIVCVLVAASLSLINLNAEERAKKVRVGWYESSFNITDEFGRRSGYAYEYQQKIAAYSGWEYEYISGSWSELLEKLINGEIDLLSDVSYTPEREEYLLFPTLPMGTEEYYLFIAPGNQEITPEDTACLNGKKVGVNKGSIQAGLFRDWVERNQLDVEVEERYSTEDESLKSLQHGNLDAYVTVDSFTNPERAVPVYKIGSSDFFFAVNKEREDLLADLNRAMSRL